MAAATGVNLVAAATEVDLVDGLELDINDFDSDIDIDVIQAMDLDLLAHDEFRGGGAYYSAIFSDADNIVSHCRHGCEDGDSDGENGAAAACAWLLARLGDDDDCGDGAEEEEARSSSPTDSGVTDDGRHAPAAGKDDDATMSAYVAELERFLMEDADADADAPCGEQAEDLLGVVDDYFAGDQLLATAEVVVPGLRAAGGAGRTDGEEEDENGGGDALATPEDEQSASRKRARNKIKGTAMMTSWGELEVMNLTMMHLAQIQSKCHHQLRLFSCAAFRMWPRAPVGLSLDLVEV